MKKITCIWAFLLSFSVFADDVNVHVDNATTAKKNKIYDLTEGEEDVTGDKSILKKTAEENWKKACSLWSSEFKKTNKDNMIISHHCGKMNCTKEGVESTCTSKATYKVKILMEE